jgi:CRP-like cAMP-binding protein
MDEGVLGRDYSDGDVICRQGEPGDCMFIVQAGRLVVVREEPEAQVVLRELGPGDIFGEMAIFERQARSATVRACGSARVLTLDRRAFLRGVHSDPSLAYRLLQTMSRRVRRLTEELSHAKAQLAASSPSPPTA